MIYIAGPGHGAPAMLSNAWMEGTYSEIYPDKSQDIEGMRKFFPRILLPRRHRQSLHAGNARLHPRRRRTRLQPLPRFRRGLRQSRPDRQLRRRRRRSGNRPSGDLLAQQQVPQSRARRRCSAHPPSERLQNRESHDPRPHSSRGTGVAPPRLRLGRRTSSKATTRPSCTSHGRHAGALRRADPRIQHDARENGKLTGGTPDGRAGP